MNQQESKQVHTGTVLFWQSWRGFCLSLAFFFFSFQQKWFVFHFGTSHQSSCIRKFLTSSNLQQHSCAAVTAPPALLVVASGCPWGWLVAGTGWHSAALPLPPAWAPCSAPGHAWLVLLCEWWGHCWVPLPTPATKILVHPQSFESQN